MKILEKIDEVIAKTYPGGNRYTQEQRVEIAKRRVQRCKQFLKEVELALGHSFAGKYSSARLRVGYLKDEIEKLYEEVKSIK